jgi:hypothetical protein
MKLIYCRDCGDVVRLQRFVRMCLCGKTAGRYLEDGIHAVISEDAVPIGIDNNSLRMAVQARIAMLMVGKPIVHEAIKNNLNLTAFVCQFASPHIKTFKMAELQVEDISDVETSPSS